jgi:hypothetical protein
MCDAGGHHLPARYGFLVEALEIRALIAETQHVIRAVQSDAERVEALRPASPLLTTDGWLPEACGRMQRAGWAAESTARAVSCRGWPALPVFTRGAGRGGDACS